MKFELLMSDDDASGYEIVKKEEDALKRVDNGEKAKEAVVERIGLVFGHSSKKVDRQQRPNYVGEEKTGRY